MDNIATHNTTKNIDMQHIERTTLSQRVAAAIKNFIIGKNLVVGDKLPSERELGKHFQVSRIIIREALKSLSMLGVVSVQQGKGTFVKSFDGKIVAEQLTFGVTSEQSLFHQLRELRNILECGAADLIVNRVTKDDIVGLREIIEQMRLAAEGGHLTEELDLEFHKSLLALSKNEPLHRLENVIVEYFRLRNLMYPPSVRLRKREEIMQEHESIVVALECGDVVEAKRLLTISDACYRDKTTVTDMK